MLVVAGELHRQAKRPERSLPLAQRLIAAFPQNWEGYARASADLLALKRFEGALATVRQGLEGASPTMLSLREVIAYAHLPGYFSDLQSLRRRREGQRGEGAGKNVLFVAGLGRNGTSPSSTTRAG